MESSERIPILLAQLMEITAEANRIREKEYVYTLEYYGGRHLWLRRRGWVFDGWTDIVIRDTRVTEANILLAIQAMRREIKRKETA